MARDNTDFLVGINFVAFLLSFPILGTGIWLRNHHCAKFLEEANLALAICVVVVSFAISVAACGQVSCFRWLYFAIILLIVAFLCFSVFALAVTDKGEGQVIAGRSYKEYHLESYSKVVRNWVNTNGNWHKQKSCLREDKVCKSLEDSNLKQAQFYKKELSPIQSGCCKPPTSCNFNYVNATVWSKPNGNTSFTDPDCNTWSNDQSSFCYDCQSCKAGVLANLKRNWYTVAVVNIIFLKFLAGACGFGFQAFRINVENAYPLHKQYPWAF